MMDMIPVALGALIVAAIVFINMNARPSKDLSEAERADIEQDLQNW